LSYNDLETEVEPISSEMETVRRKLRELEDKIAKIDRLDKLEARVKALEEKLQKK
jgi:Skp family chaperone for outer membrane proteins